jgi:hypothetical protein
VTEPDRNVTAGTTDSSHHNRPENGTELLPDRLAEIRARLDAWREVRYPAPGSAVLVDDVAWLLGEVERLAARVRMYEEVKS